MHVTICAHPDIHTRYAIIRRRWWCSTSQKREGAERGLRTGLDMRSASDIRTLYPIIQ